MLRHNRLKHFMVFALSSATLSPLFAHAEDTGPSFEVYGFAMVDYVQDFKRVNPAWEDTLRPSKIPTVAGQYGSDGQATITPKQSRLGVQGNIPVEGQPLFTKFEFDWFGVGADEGKVTPRLRHAYGQWGQWLAGQTHSLFMDIDVFPNVTDYWGPAGMVFLRNPQIRWTPMSGDRSFAIAIERPTNDLDPGVLREVDPAFGANVQVDEKLPDLTAQFRQKTGFGHVQLAGILRRLGYDTTGNFDSSPKGKTVGWGFDLSSSIALRDYDKILLSGVYGRGVASYMNDGGTDLAPDGTLGAPQASAVPLFGLMAYYEHPWSEHWNSTIGYSRTQVENRSLQAGGAFHSGEYASANILYLPSKSILMGAEFLWGRRKDNDGNQGNDVRTQISFKYSFSSKDLLSKS
ncbi:MAG: DcaP family trimeric outer membrane transporter [Bdellovibrionia bacterium]